jgi:dihydrofolate synthase / folylpolyglutamate synthase
VDYPNTLNRLYAHSKRGVTLGLDRVRLAAFLLGNPERDLLSVQIGGTNGKGTASATLAHALTYSGLKTGLFTSPHLHRFSERIRIDGKEAPPNILGPHLERVLNLNDEHKELSLSFFEIATLAALLTFKEARVDVAVLEVGLGGRLDATTVAEPRLTAVTSVAFDHTALLGNTEEQIAAEKAGIARPGASMVLGALSQKALAVAKTVARDKGVAVSVIHRDFFVPVGLVPPWPGRHQLENVAIAAELYRLLGEMDDRILPAAFAEALPTVFWPGRFEIVQARHRWILDCAHNLQAAQALARTVRESGEKIGVLLFGALRDKPAKEMLEIYRPLVKSVVLMPPPIDRAENPASLALPGDIVTADATEAGAAADREADAHGTVLVTGSIFTVAKVRELLLDEPADPPVGL